MKLRLQRLKFLFVATAIILVAACSEQKKLIQAEQRVLTNPESFNYIGGKWAKLNPCVLDSVVKYSNNEITKTDTFYNHGDFVYAPAIHDTLFIRRMVTNYDTTRIYLRDKRIENILKDSIQYYQLSSSRAETGAEIAKQQAEKSNRLVILWIVLFAVENVILIILKAKGL